MPTTPKKGVRKSGNLLGRGTSLSLGLMLAVLGVRPFDLSWPQCLHVPQSWYALFIVWHGNLPLNTTESNRRDSFQSAPHQASFFLNVFFLY